jgi:hypothetical protein
MRKIIYAPNNLNVIGTTIFLAGSIEMGKAENWQSRVEKHFEDAERDITLLNPRRLDWDSSWEQSISNARFREQVEWELNALEKADYIFLYLSPGTKSPISLLELGLFAHSGKLIVCCPDGFWRKGNVDIVCKKYNITLYSILDFAISSLELRI